MKKSLLIGIAIFLILLVGMAKASSPEKNRPEPKKEIERCTDCETSNSGIAFIQLWEGYSPFPYADVAGYMTIGHGHLIKPGERFDGPLLPPDAYVLLQSDLRRFERAINRLVNPPLHQHQFDALASFTFNLGEGAFSKSTLLRRVNAERHAEAAREFKKWVFAGGKRVRGLVLRREAESLFYIGL
jgi:lysozyme